MILSGEFLNTLVNGFNIHPKICGKIFTYDRNQKTFCVVEKRSAKSGYLIRWAILLLVAIAFVYQILRDKMMYRKTEENEHTAVTKLSMYSFVAVVFFLASERYRIRGNDPKSYRAFLNAALQMEANYNDGLDRTTRAKIKAAKALLYLLFSGVVRYYPFCLAIGSAIKPTLPLNLAFFFNVNNIPLPPFSYALIAITFISNYLLYLMMVVQGCMVMLEILTGIMSLTFIQKQTKRKFLDMIEQLNQSNVPTDNKNVTAAIIQRSVHIVVELFNKAIGHLFVSCFVGAGIGQIISAFILINSGTAALPMLPLKLAYSLIAISACPIILVLYGFAGEFYESSVKSIQEMKKIVDSKFTSSRKRGKEMKMVLKACQPQKIRFGMSNFVDQLTPLVFQQFCVDKIIDLVLLQQ